MWMMPLHLHVNQKSDFYDMMTDDFFSKKNSHRNTIRVSNSLDPDQDRYYVRPGLGTNCLQSPSADKKMSLAGKVLTALIIYIVLP